MKRQLRNIQTSCEPLQQKQNVSLICDTNSDKFNISRNFQNFDWMYDFPLNITWKHISKRWQHVCYSIYLSIFHVYFLLTCCSFFLSSLRQCYTTALLTGNPLVMHQVPLEVVHWNGKVGSGICNWNFYLLIWMLGLCSIDGREVVGAVQNVGIFVLAGRLLCTWHTVSM